jgi:hypothetical protein
VRRTGHLPLLPSPHPLGRSLWRRRQKNYAEASRIKAVADELERRERERMDEERLTSFAQKEAKFRAQQAAELSALLKRIETRRTEHVKQRELDSKRLLQRNKNVQAVLEGRHAAEEQRKVADIKLALQPPRTAYARLAAVDTGAAAPRKPVAAAPSPARSPIAGLLARKAAALAGPGAGNGAAAPAFAGAGRR